MIRVLIVEDDDVTRSVLRETLESDSEFSIVGEFSNASEAREAAAAAKPDVAVIDLALGEESGIALIAALREIIPETELMAHTMFDDRDNVFKALRAGAVSYLLKGVSPLELCSALRDMRSGGAPMSPKIARLVIKDMHAGADLLSPRERQILRDIDQGLTYKEVAAKLAISVHTVHSHIKSVYERLQASGKKEALARARERGLL